MARFKYLGKAKEFKLDPVYKFQTPLNPGDVFELTGNDLLIMKRCIVVTKEQSAGYCDFILNDEYEMNEAEAEVEEAVEAEEAQPEVDYNDMTKFELLDICKEKGVELPANALKKDILELLKNYK